MKEVDYIIVGQGLAGSVLAYSLIQEKQKVIVVDEEAPSSSSRVAAGMCNPLVFKKLNKSWMIDDVLPIAKQFYRDQELILKDNFYFDVPFYKLFADKKEQEFWRQKSNEPHLFDWMDVSLEEPFPSSLISYPFGASKTLQSGFLKTEKWLDAFKLFLKDKAFYFSGSLDYHEINFLENGIQWGGFLAKKIIFCEGYKTKFNPYFDWLPLKLTKGEILTVNFKNIHFEGAINKGAFVLPCDGNYRLGATYDWGQIDTQLTEGAKRQLLERAGRFIKDEIVVIEHKAGVRPTVSDRRPILGMHPEFQSLCVFNGLGTKGVMLAPYFAKKMTKFLLEDQELPEEVSIERFILQKEI